MVPPHDRLTTATWVVGLLALTGLTGCSSSTAQVEDARPVRFAVIAAPRVGAPAPKLGPGVGAGEEALSAEDLLLEVVTQLSTEVGVEFTLVPGPLLAKADDEESREGLVGALGSLAGPVFVAVEKPTEALTKALGEGLKGHPGKDGYAGKRVGPVRPVALAASGELPQAEGSSDPEAKPKPLSGRLIAVRAGGTAGGAHALPLEVTAGKQLAVVRGPSGGSVTLTVPPLTEPPHLFAILTIDDGLLTIELRTALGTPAPKPPASIRLWPSGKAP